MKRFICWIKGHRVHCAQSYVLGPNVVMHKHQCLRCNQSKEFPQEPMSDELLGILLSLVGQPKQTLEEPASHKHLLN